MKKINFTTRSLVSALALGFVLTFSACSADSDTSYTPGSDVLNKPNKENTPTENPFSFALKVTSDGKDITTKGDLSTTTLFIFDENDNFIQQMNIDKATILNRKKISISAPNAKTIKVVAWGGLINNKEEVSSLNQTNVFSDLRVQLKKTMEQVAISPSDLFYGQLQLNRPAGEEIQTLNIERKISSLTLATKNIAKKFGNSEGDFYYKVTTKYDSFDHNGKLTGSTAEYILPAYMNENGHLSAESITVLPSDEVSIELYRDDIMVLSSKKSKKTESLSLDAAKQLHITMDFYNTNFAVTVAEYGVVLQVVNVG